MTRARTSAFLLAIAAALLLAQSASGSTLKERLSTQKATIAHDRGLVAFYTARLSCTLPCRVMLPRPVALPIEPVLPQKLVRSCWKATMQRDARKLFLTVSDPAPLHTGPLVAALRLRAAPPTVVPLPTVVAAGKLALRTCSAGDMTAVEHLGRLRFALAEQRWTARELDETREALAAKAEREIREQQNREQAEQAAERARQQTVSGTWSALANCESGGNWAYNGSSGFDGGLQFAPDTWSAYRRGDEPAYAYEASPAVQVAVAERVLASQGWGAWPVCSYKIGVR